MFQAIVSRRIVLAGVMGLAVCGTAAVKRAAAAEDVVIGVIQPLSGPNAQFGIGSQRGTELAAEMINAAGGIKALGGAKISLVTADVPTPATAAAATQRLISQNNVSAVIRAFVSSERVLAVFLAPNHLAPCWLCLAFDYTCQGIAVGVLCDEN